MHLKGIFYFLRHVISLSAVNIIVRKYPTSHPAPYYKKYFHIYCLMSFRRIFFIFPHKAHKDVEKLMSSLWMGRCGKYIVNNNSFFYFPYCTINYNWLLPLKVTILIQFSMFLDFCNFIFKAYSGNFIFFFSKLHFIAG